MRYELVEENATIATPPFPKQFFFGSHMGTKVALGDNFRTLFVPEVSDTVLGGVLHIAYRDLKGVATDAENLREIGEENVFTPDEWTRVLYANLSILKKERFRMDRMNITYVRMRVGALVAAYAMPDSDGSWYFGANPVDDRVRKDPERRLFSLAQSSTAS